MLRERMLVMLRSTVLTGAAVAALVTAPTNAMAQALKDVRVADSPLVLKAQGSFFVGGQKVEQAQGELGDLGPGDTSPSTRCTCATWCRKAARAMSPW